MNHFVISGLGLWTRSRLCDRGLRPGGGIRVLCHPADLALFRALRGPAPQCLACVTQLSLHALVSGPHFPLFMLPNSHFHECVSTTVNLHLYVVRASGGGCGGGTRAARDAGDTELSLTAPIRLVPGVFELPRFFVLHVLPAGAPPPVANETKTHNRNIG